MIGSFLTRGLVMILGYAYPAYECYKTVEKNKPDVEQLRFWCQYWILVAMLTVMERVGDTFVSWVPMYSEAKLFFFIYLWYPKTKPQQAARVRQPTAGQSRHAAATSQMQVDEPASPTASASGESKDEMIEKKNPSEVPASAPPLVAAMNAQKSAATQSITTISSKPATSNEAALATDTASSSVKEVANPPGPDAVMDENMRVTRGRLRRTRVNPLTGAAS